MLKKKDNVIVNGKGPNNVMDWKRNFIYYFLLRIELIYNEQEAQYMIFVKVRRYVVSDISPQSQWLSFEIVFPAQRREREKKEILYISVYNTKSVDVPMIKEHLEFSLLSLSAVTIIKCAQKTRKQS